MLFDLRGRGRRRTIQAIYLGLAILMGGGLVLFGIGGNTSGGLFDAFKNDVRQGGGGVTFDKRVKTAQARATADPKNPAAWATLARLRYQQAGAVGYDQNTGSFTDKGKEQLAGVAVAWDHYIALDPKKPDDKLASLMVQAFGPTGLNKLDKAVSAQEIVTPARKPSPALYGQLAVLAYAAGQSRKGDLAADKAVALAPKSQRAELKSQLQSAKAQSAAQAIQGAQGTG
jgi:hypothetical protein